MEQLTRKKLLSVSNFQTCYQQYGQVEPKENTKLNETKLTEENIIDKRRHSDFQRGKITMMAWKDKRPFPFYHPYSKSGS